VPSTLPECVIALPGLRVLQWSELVSNLADVSNTILATCTASAHRARVADLVFKVKLSVNFFFLTENEFIADVQGLRAEVQGMRDEWQAERARLEAAGVGGSREVHLKTLVERSNLVYNF